MVYLYKCPFLVSWERDSSIECGSVDFVNATFLTEMSVFSHLTEAKYLNISLSHFHTVFPLKKIDPDAAGVKI